MTLHNQDWITLRIIKNKFIILLHGYPVKLVRYNKTDTSLYFITIIFNLLNLKFSFAE